MLVVDDVLTLPGKIGEIVFNSILQTAHSTAWTEYSDKLKKMLIQARYDFDKGKITQEQYKEVESYVFKEMRSAGNALKDEKTAKPVPYHMAVWVRYLEKLEATWQNVQEDYKAGKLSKEEYEPLEKHFTNEISDTRKILDKAVTE